MFSPVFSTQKVIVNKQSSLNIDFHHYTDTNSQDYSDMTRTVFMPT